MTITRRAVVGGLVGAGATAGLTGVVAADTPPPSSGPPGSSRITLHSTGLRIAGAGGSTPSAGEVQLVEGTLTDHTGAKGVLHAEYRTIASANMVGGSAPTSIETHHFVLTNGTITGSGTATFDDLPDEFAIVGGTGAYRGARGSYSATQRHLGLGGDGTATYEFTLLAEGV